MSGVVALLAALQLISLHRVDGGEVWVNPSEVTSVVSPRSERDQNRTMHPGARCIVHLTDGKLFGTLETCGQVRQLLEGR